jgi:hypothetical protein
MHAYDLSRKGILVRHEDDADRRRRIIDISPKSRPAIAQWLSPGANAWRHALTPLSPAQQRMFVDTLLRYEAAFSTATQTAPRAIRSTSPLRGPRRDFAYADTAASHSACPTWRSSVLPVSPEFRHDDHHEESGMARGRRPWAIAHTTPVISQVRCVSASLSWRRACRNW